MGKTPFGDKAARLALFCVTATLLVVPSSSFAAGSMIPADLQAELISKLAGYDRNFVSRAGSVALVLIAARPGNARSTVSAGAMKSELGKLDRIGGLPHREVVVNFESAAALAARCRAERAAIVYLTPGLDDEVAELQRAFAGVDVLSVSGVPEAVPSGIVLGFELTSGKPRIMLNLPQAKRQNVSFSAQILALMKLFR